MAIDPRVRKTAEEILKETRLILQAYPEHEKIRDPVDGMKMLTKKEVLSRFDGDDDFAAKIAAKIFGLKLDVFLRKGKQKHG